MWRLRFIGFGALALLLVAAVAVGCGDDDDGGGDGLAGRIPPPTERIIEVTAFEVKGATSANDLAPPDVDPSTLSAGFGYKAPGVYDVDNPDKWQVASYMWTPGQIVAYVDDVLNLHFFVLNGNKHTVWIEGPDGETVVDETVMNRGREYNITVKPTKAGVYRLICITHAPTMTAEIVVLPR